MTIQLEQLAKTYADSEVPVLTDVSVQVADNEFFVIVGPSGCGKSTLLRMIAGLTSISAGQLKINGVLANDLPPKARQLAMVFQSYALYPFLTVAANVGFGLKARHFSAPEIQQRVAHALKMVNLTELKDRKPKALSGGQRQRVALARAIASDAKICLMDEPLSNLDAQLRARMRLELKQLQQQLGLTVIYVTHDQVEAMTMADRVMILNEHQVQQIDTPINVYQNPKNEFVAQFFGTPQINLLTATVTGHQLQVTPDLNLAVTRPLPEGTALCVGIRPNQLQFKLTSRNANARIQTVAYLGDKLVATARLSDDQAVRLVSAETTTLAPGDLIAITGAQQVVLFDNATGKLITTEQEVAARATIAVG